MRQQTKTYTLYKYDELSESAKEKALQQYSEHSDYGWSQENRDTLEAFEEIFPIKVTNWEYDQWRGNVSFRCTADNEIEELSGIRLLTYIYNNYFRDLFKGRYYSTPSRNNLYHHRSRHSKVIFEHSCVLTGYGIDDDTLDPIYDFLKKPDPNTTFYSLMNDCLQAWASACSKDMEYYFSEEAFKETCEANEWEFLEDGSML